MRQRQPHPRALPTVCYACGIIRLSIAIGGIPMKDNNKVKPEKRTDTVVLNEIRDVMNQWATSTHKWRSSHATVKISKILEQ